MSEKNEEALPVAHAPLSLPNAWSVIERSATELHRLLRWSQRDRWWFLKGKQRFLEERRGILWDRILYTAESGALAARIRAGSYQHDMPPVVSVDFWLPSAVRKRLTIRVGLRGEGKSIGTLGLKALRDMSQQERLRWLKGMRRKRSGKPESGSALWWIDPKETPERVTLLALLVYLNRQELFDCANDPRAQRLVRSMISKGGRGSTIHNHSVRSIFNRLTMYFAVPQDWKQLRRYLALVSRTELAGGSRNTKLAEEIEVPLRTVQRWGRKETEKQGKRLPKDLGRDAGQAGIRKHAQERTYRRALMLVLEKCGKSKEAARKSIQRRLAKGESLETQLKDLGKNVNRGSEV